MPTQDNCEDLKVESCVDDNGQTINGGDSYEVPTGRYVKHVVNVCGSGGAAAGGLKTTACPDGGLEETWSGPDEVCLSIKTEDDSALVLDNGVLKIDSTKLKVTTDNVFPAGTDPGLLTTLPAYVGPEGEVWDTQADYNQWLYHDQKRQDEELEEFKESLKCDLETWVVSPDLPKDGEIHFNSGDLINLPASTFGIFKVGDALVIEGERCTIYYASDHLEGNAPDQYWSIKASVPDRIKSLPEVTIDLCDTSDYVTRYEFEQDQQRQDEANLALDAFIEAELIALNKKFEEDQKRQDDEFAADQERQDNEIETLKGLISGGGGVGEPSGQCEEQLKGHGFDYQRIQKSGDPDIHWAYNASGSPLNFDIGPTFCTHVGDRSNQRPYVGEWFTAVDSNGGKFRGKVKSLRVTHHTDMYGFEWHWSHYELEGVEDTTTEKLEATICVESSINEDPTYNFVTHPEFETDQKRQDDALADEIKSREERDLLHDAQLNTIEYKLDQLIGLQFKGIYEFKHENDCNEEYERCVENCMAIDPQDHDCRQMCGRNQMDCEREKVRPGYFEAVDPDDQFDHLEYIVISKSDKAGVEIEWANVLKKDDYLEVDHTAQGVLDKTNYGLYRIIEDPEETLNAYGEEVYTLHLEFLQGDGVMNVRENYEIRGITAAEGINPEELGDFLTKEEAADLYALKTHGHAWTEISGKPSTYPPSSHTHSDYVSKSTTSEQTLNSSLSGKYYYGQTSSRDNGMMCRKDIEALVSSSGGGSDGSDHNHDSRYVKGNYTISYSSGSYYIS